MRHPAQPVNPRVELRQDDSGEVTLSIDDEQSMQGWERPLMYESADILTTYGSTFLEAGLGLGYSAERIATRATRHVVVEAYQEVIDLYLRSAQPPASMEIVHADFFEHIHRVPDESVDGIFFDPALADATWKDVEFMRAAVRRMRAILRPGGALLPFFSTKPTLRLPFAEEFDTIVVHRRPYQAYGGTTYTHERTEGDAYIQCFVK